MDEWLVSHKWQKAPALISIAKITPHLILLLLVLQKKVLDTQTQVLHLYHKYHMHYNVHMLFIMY